MYGVIPLGANSAEFMPMSIDKCGLSVATWQVATSSLAPWQDGWASLKMAEHVFVTYEICDLLAQS